MKIVIEGSKDELKDIVSLLSSNVTATIEKDDSEDTVDNSEEIITKDDKKITQQKIIDMCKKGIIDQLSVGSIVHLNNDLCSTFYVADVNHEGTKNTVDLIPTNILINMKFSSANNRYEYSDIDTWINTVYINKFDKEIIELLKDMKVEWFNSRDGIKDLQRKAKLLSITELNMIDLYEDMPNRREGKPYPLFYPGKCNEDNNGRIFYPGKHSTTNNNHYWLRSIRNNSSMFVWIIDDNGNGKYMTNYNDNYGVLPVIRLGI